MTPPATIADIAAGPVVEGNLDRGSPVAWRGVVSHLRWTHPHSRLYLDIVGSDGVTVSFLLEFGSVAALLRRGLRSADVPLGTEVLATGFWLSGNRSLASASCVTSLDGRIFYAGDRASRA